ncbi:hypothetical protein [Enterobacter asburiae]|uniref:hypothetical protein n=1 Tax=Enterobacter asburiae TaxID=61645 RepID=UPI00192C9BF4|nr:hypothetical protein [Enterobacter asburiae]MBL5927817.1 hypothetical protein [Enterobacter asburiae]MBL5958604.1 hypothetical protein [Enterobacter asburiae]
MEISITSRNPIGAQVFGRKYYRVEVDHGDTVITCDLNSAGELQEFAEHLATVAYENMSTKEIFAHLKSTGLLDDIVELATEAA